MEAEAAERTLTAEIVHRLRESLRRRGVFGEIELVRKFLRPGDYVLDIGTNIGTHAIPLAKAVGHEGQVIAFEPQPTRRARLQDVELMPQHQDFGF